MTIHRSISVTSALIVWLLIDTSAFGEQAFVEYRIREGDTCESIAERLYGAKRHANVIHDYNPRATQNRSQCNSDLRPGSKLRLPRRAPEQETPDAEVTAVHRLVKSRPPGQTAWGKARLGQDLFRGWRVNTLEESAANLTFLDSSVLQLRENTLVVIFGPTSLRVRRMSAKAVLERGALRSRLGELSGGLRVNTSSARAHLRQGHAMVSVDEQSTSRVANFSGKAATVASSKGRGRVRVEPNMGSKVERFGVPSTPRPLPPPPQWRENEPDTFIAVRGRSLVKGSWTPVEVARHYRVELSTQPNGRGPIGATGVPARITSFELQGLRPGDYYLSVSSIDEDQFESRPSSWRHIRVVEARLVSPLDEATKTSTEPADPGAEAPLSLIVGSRLISPEGFTCGFGDGPRGAEVILTATGPATIRCTGPSGIETSGFPTEVVPIQVSLDSKNESSIATVPRGRASTLSLSLRSKIALPENIVVRGGIGLSVEELGWDGEGSLELSLEADADASEEVSLYLFAIVDGSPMHLARLSINTIDAEPSTSSEPTDISESNTSDPKPLSLASTPPNRRLFAANESSWLLIRSHAFGLRDTFRQGQSLWAAFGVSNRDGVEDEYLGLTALGFEISTAKDRLRLTVGFSLGLWRSEAGARLGVCFRLLDRLRLALSLGLDTWFPFSGLENVRAYDARLIPSFDVSGRLARRFHLRTRQGALLNTGTEGSNYWASAYGFDAWIFSIFSVFAEGVLLLGTENGSLRVAPTLGGGLSFVFWNFVDLSVGAQVSLTDDARDLLGRFTLHSSLRFVL